MWWQSFRMADSGISTKSCLPRSSRGRDVSWFAMLRQLLLVIALISSGFAAEDSREIQYRITLGDALQHKLHVQVRFPLPTAGDLQLPVWNATYQVRDFAQYVSNVKAQGAVIRKINSSRWHLEPSASTVTVDYDYVADLPGPFGDSYDQEQAFFNFAMLLMYPVEQRSAPVRVEIEEAPEDWLIATSLPAIGGTQEGRARFALHARNYDHLVDSPVEL